MTDAEFYKFYLLLFLILGMIFCVVSAIAIIGTYMTGGSFINPVVSRVRQQRKFEKEMREIANAERDKILKQIEKEKEND